MNPIAFTIYGFNIKWYSLLIVIGIMFSWLLITKESKKFKIQSDFLTNLIFWVIIFGIIGARLYYVAFQWDYYSTHLNEIYKVWEGGLAIYGGIIFGIFTILIYCHKYKVTSLKIMDIIAPYLIFSQGLGRWGNFFNSEAYGVITTFSELQNNKLIPDFVVNGMYINGNYYTPTFYYEFLWCMLGFIVLLIFRKLKYTRIGQTTGLYLIWYSVGRFFIESLRLDSLMFNDIRVSQVVSIILFIIGLILFLIQYRKPVLESLYNSNEEEKVVNF